MKNKKRINLELSKNSHWVTSRELKVTLGGKHNINFDKNLPLIIKPIHFYIDYTMTTNYHDYLEITYVLDGNGEFIIGSKKYPVRKGDIFVINNVELHVVTAGRVCEGYSLKNKCSTNKGNTATIYTDKSGIILAKMAEKMKKDSSKEIYEKRKIIVEPVFGQIKTGGFKRFSLGDLERQVVNFPLYVRFPISKK